MCCIFIRLLKRFCFCFVETISVITNDGRNIVVSAVFCALQQNFQERKMFANYYFFLFRAC